MGRDAIIDRLALCRRVRVFRSSLILLVALVAPACGADGLAAPTTIAPVIVCPTAVNAESGSGAPIPVTFEPPQVIGGETPLRLACTPESGTSFPIGTTPVTCTVTDAVLRANVCVFPVNVTQTPPLAATTFMAFGNSITEGKNGFSTVVANPYPAVLSNLLKARYTPQAAAIEVVNRGFGGEWAITGAVRIHEALDAVNPQVLLLQEGVNDISASAANLPSMINALRDMVREARSRGIRVYLATLLPQRAGGSRAFAVATVPDANVLIRQLAAAEGAVLVDLYEGFGGSPDPWIDVDGLHPNEAGYQKIGELFFESIKSTLQTSAPVSLDLARHMALEAAPGARALR
jgi:lysophospholipase L1-like esterase